MPERSVPLVVNDPDGRRVVLDQDAWRHIVQEHMEMASHQAAVMAAIARPDHRDEDARPVRERYWRLGWGPADGCSWS